MWSFQLKEKWRELGCSKWLCCGWLPKVDLIPRTLLAQITVPIEISYRDCAGLRHRARLKTKAPRSTITKARRVRSSVLRPHHIVIADDVVDFHRFAPLN